MSIKTIVPPVLLAAAAALITSAGPAVPVEAAGSAFPFPTGRITYQMKSSMINGTNVLSWVEGGRKVRNDVKGTAAFNGQQMPVNSWTISDGKSIYTHDAMLGKQVMRVKVPKGASQKVASGMPVITVGKNAGKVIGKGNVLGRPCEIRQVGNARLWVWKNLPLKMVSTASAQGMAMTLVATRVETSVRLSPTQFTVPSGYVVKDAQMPPAVRPVKAGK